MDRIIVTGVNGFVGSHLVDALMAENYEVIGVGREESLSTELTDRVQEYYSCDLSNYEEVAKLPLANAKGVINLAGLAAVGPSFDNPELYMRVNTAVLDTVCKAAIEQNATDIRIISISSGAVYSSQQPMPLSEESGLAPESSPYAASKIAMEELSLQYRKQGLDCVVARPFNHIGPGQLPGFILPDLFKEISLLSEGENLRVGNLTTKRDYTDVRDVAKAYASLISAKTLNHGIYNVCTGRSLSGEYILEKLKENLNVPTLIHGVDETRFRPSDAPDLFGDSSKLQADTGWTPQIPIEQTIRDFIEWAE